MGLGLGLGLGLGFGFGLGVGCAPSFLLEGKSVLICSMQSAT